MTGQLGREVGHEIGAVPLSLARLSLCLFRAFLRLAIIQQNLDVDVPIHVAIEIMPGATKVLVYQTMHELINHVVRHIYGYKYRIYLEKLRRFIVTLSIELSPYTMPHHMQRVRPQRCEIIFLSEDHADVRHFRIANIGEGHPGMDERPGWVLSDNKAHMFAYNPHQVTPIQ